MIMLKQKHLSAKLIWLTLLASVAACKVGPDYEPPTPPAYEKYSETVEAQDPNVQLASWWKSLGDPVLDGLVIQTVQNNQDLKIAIARLKESRATTGKTSTEIFPSVDGVADYNVNKISNAQVPVGNPKTDLFSAGFDAIWEIDVFGRVRRKIEGAEAETQAVEADLKNVLTSVVAEVARSYFELRGFQHRLRVLRENLKTQEESLAISTNMFEAGASSEIDVVRARGLLESTKAKIAPAEASIKVSEYKIELLTGGVPGSLKDKLVDTSDIKYSWPLNLESPEALLRRRPDIEAAERRLAAATADIGVAIGEYFPKVTFSGNLGLQAHSPNSFSDDGNNFYNYGPKITWSIINFNRIRYGVRAAKAREEAAFDDYERVVLTALQEVEATLATFGGERAALESLEAAAIANRRAADLAKIQYDSGEIDFLALLDADREALQTEELYVLGLTRCNTQLVALYKALGGGWEGNVELVNQQYPEGLEQDR